MVTAVTRNIYSATIKTILTGYVPRSPTWSLQQGNPWPIASYCRQSITAPAQGVAALACDVFYLDSAGVAHVTLNSWGDMTAGLNSGSALPGWWNGRLVGLANHTFNLGGANVTPYLTRYNTGAPLGVSIVRPNLPEVGTTATTAASSFDPNGMGPVVLMPVLGQASYSFAADNSLTNPYKVWTSDDTLEATFATFQGALYGAIPGTPWWVIRTNTNSVLGIRAIGGAISPQPISWDDANLNTLLQGLNGLSFGNSTIFGTVNYLGNITIKGVNYPAALSLTAPDGSYYDIIQLFPGDAQSTIALSGAAGNRSAVIDPNGFLWFQSNSNDLDRVYGVSLAGPSGLTGKLLPIFYPQALPNPPADPNPITKQVR